MSGCRVVTVALAMSSHGEEIAHLVADELQFRYIDDEIITQAAARAGVSREEVEQVEQSASLVTRILTALGELAPGAALPGLAVSPGLWQVSPGLAGSTAWAVAMGDASAVYRDLIQEVIRDTAREGEVVILAHAASIYLARMPGLLRVLATAAPETRAGRLAATEKIDQRKALREIDDSDRERRAYLRRFYGIRQELPTHYDLVINTDVLPPLASARAIVAAAKAIS